jgi:hypothetical protein
MELSKFIKTIRNEKVEEIIVRTKDCVYRWKEDKAFIAPIKKETYVDSGYDYKKIYNGTKTNFYLNQFFTDSEGNICIKGTI